MGVCANTDFTIECEDNKTAKKVAKLLRDQKEDEYGNTFGQDIKVYDSSVEASEYSGKIQNLSYRCRKIWELVKDIKGVLQMDCPFMIEGEGEYYSNEDK